MRRRCRRPPTTAARFPPANQFAEPAPTQDPAKFVVKHGSDAAAYKILNSEKGTLKPRPFPVVTATEPTLSLAVIGQRGPDVLSATIATDGVC